MPILLASSASDILSLLTSKMRIFSTNDNMPTAFNDIIHFAMYCVNYILICANLFRYVLNIIVDCINFLVYNSVEVIHMTYTGLAFPKPKCKKGNSRKPKNNPAPTIEDRCAICGRPYASLHEVFYGNDNRQNSIEWGMQIRLCIYHHQVGPEAVHNNPAFNDQLKEKYQKIFEQQHGHEKFMEVFGENYIDESEWVFMDE